MSFRATILTLYPEMFQCGYCELVFGDVEEMSAAGLYSPIDIENVDPSDFIDPDYLDER